ncbi:hypothetical protein GCM10011507_02400 [Edaphobacter acidisoli]|uniref:Uncharacterized protein n=1 Tax=Edaphobacter acidisoli TaxID=2040573 RepID=A0A916VZ43_9BACT|nr:hypothetical protein GCM10011507_02400 [Edaphobacter acidisoli]
MKGDLERRGESDHLACALNVHATVGMQDAEHEAASAKAAGVEEIFAHELKLVGGVDEVAAARAKKYMNGQAAAADCFFDERVARGEAAFTQRRAELDAVRATFARGQAGLDALCT